MRCDHLPDRVSVDEASEEDEGHEMVVEDFGVEPEVGWDQGPCDKKGDQAEEGAAGFVAALAADLNHVEGAADSVRRDSVCKRASLRLDSVEDKEASPLHHVPLVKCEVVDVVRDESVVGDAHRLEHALLPKAGSALDGRKGVDQSQEDDPFNRAGNDAEREGLGVVLVPGLYVEGK